MCDRNIIVPPRKSSATFGNLRQSSGSVWKMFGDVDQAFGTILENLRKSAESGRKSSGKSSKTSLLVCLYNKPNNTWTLGDMEFIFSCSHRYRTSERSEQVRYRKSSEIFGKWSEIFGKSSKTSLLVCLYNKQNNTWTLGDMGFIFSCSHSISHSFASLTRSISM